jgi:hypothetical protein
MPVSRHLYLIEPLLLSLHNNILHVVGFNKSSLYVYKLQCRPNHGVELAKGGQARKKSFSEQVVPNSSCSARTRIMGNSLRCCLACVLPCGSFDVVRIVHLSGHIEEYTRPVTAGEVIAAHPNHVLSRPSSQGGARRILIVDSDSELKRGCFYFLVPASSVLEKKNKPATQQEKKKVRPKKTVPCSAAAAQAARGNNGDRYLSEVLSEGKASLRHRRSIRKTVWRPHLHSIVEEADDS